MMEHFSYEGGRGGHGRTHIEPFKKELSLAADKWLWVISTIMLFKNSYSTKEMKRTNEQRCFKLITILYALLCGP